MATAAAPARALLPPGRTGPALIAHGAGNTVAAARDAVGVAADYVEVDLWVHRGRFEARHERRTVFPLPFLFEKWYVRFAPLRPFGLAELLKATAGKVGIFLDLKNGGETTAQLVRRSLDEAGGERQLVASSQTWGVLRALAATAPEVALFYSIDVQAKLDLFLSVSDRDLRPTGVSCRESLLSPRVIRELKERGLLVVAWTVDDERRAVELAGLGVDGITTHRVAAVRAALTAT